MKELSADPGICEYAVSVIVPCFNREKLISRALESVFAQTYRPIELVVVDDGSADNSVARVQSWAAERDGGDVTTRLIRKSNGGAASARNAGLRACTGGFIQFLDSDDVLVPDKLAAHVQALVSNDAEYAWSPMVVEQLSRDDGVPPRIWFADPETVPESCCVGLYRRSLVARIGFLREDLYSKEDYDYRYRLESVQPRKVFVPGVKYRAFEHELGRENDKFGTTRDIEAILEILDSARSAGIRLPGLRASLSARYRHCLDSAIDLGEARLALMACDGLLETATNRHERIRTRLIRRALVWGGANSASNLIGALRRVRMSFGARRPEGHT